MSDRPTARLNLCSAESRLSSGRKTILTLTATEVRIITRGCYAYSPACYAFGGGNKTYVALTWLEAQPKMSGKWLSLSH